MRLQLSRRVPLAAALLVAIAAGLAAAPRVEAQDRDPGEVDLVAKQSLYADDDATTVATTLVDGEVGLPGRTSAGVHVLVDVISAASVDVVSQATPSFDEVRIETGARFGVEVAPDVDLGFAFTRSAENDWESLTGQTSLTAELARKNTRLSAAYGFSSNRVGRAEDPTFDEDLDAHTVELGLSQVLDPSTVVGLVYTGQLADGWLSSPYRFVTTRDGRFSVLETHPDDRLRHAVTVSALRHLGEGLALDTSYRLYGDDWGLVSHTVSGALRVDLGDGWGARLRSRAYLQSEADFWRERYDELARYMSADRELSRFWSLGLGGKVDWSAGAWAVDLKVDGFYYAFPDFEPLDDRLAVVADVGARVTW